MKKIIVVLLLFAGLVGCNKNNYQVGNPKEQACVRVFAKENKLDFSDYSLQNNKTTGCHQSIIDDNSGLWYIDYNSVVYEYGDRDKSFNDIVYLINEERCMFGIKYRFYVNDYGREKYYQNFCKLKKTR